MIYQIAYWSKASLPMSQSELKKLELQCLSNNQGSDVTGYLLYGHHTFFQFIEGPYKAVQALYQEILGDKRHFDVKKIGEWCMPERQFANWAMGFTVLDNPEVYANYHHLLNWRSTELVHNKDAMRRLLLEFSNLAAPIDSKMM